MAIIDVHLYIYTLLVYSLLTSQSSFIHTYLDYHTARKLEQLDKMLDKLKDDIDELLRLSNFKRCYEQLAESRKRYPRSALIDRLELYVEYRQLPDRRNYATALNDLTPTRDVSALQLQHQFLMELRAFEDARTLYERSYTRSPGPELAHMWLNNAIEYNDFTSAARACLQLSKIANRKPELFPAHESRDFQIWYALCILCAFKFHPLDITESERAILPKLAYSSLLGTKPYRSTHEIYILCQIYEVLYQNDAKVLENIISVILPTIDTSVDLYLKNFLMKHLNDPQLTFEVCQKMVTKLNDYDILRNLIRSGKSLGKDKNKILEFVDKCVGDHRNSRLLRFEADVVFDGEISLQSMKFYLEKFHNKPCCVVDISSYLQFTDKKSLVIEFGKCIPCDVQHSTNASKLKLTDSQDYISMFQSFKSDLINKSNLKYTSVSHFILKTVAKILTDSINSNSKVMHIIVSLTILENYRASDPNNYQVLVWLVALYMQLGLVPLAYQHYKTLKIKNVQVDSLDYLLFSRFSTIFPDKQHAVFSKTFKDNENLYYKSLVSLPEFIRIAFEKRSYNKIIGMIDLNKRLSASYLRWMKLSDKLQLARLRNEKTTFSTRSYTMEITKLSLMRNDKYYDNRDFSIFDEYIDRESLWKIFSYFHTDSRWLEIAALKEKMIQCIQANESNEELDHALERVLGEEYFDKNQNSLTNAERFSFESILALYNNDSKALLSQLKKCRFLISNEGWEVFHSYLTVLYTLKTLDKQKRIKDVMIKKEVREQLTALRDSCDTIHTQYSVVLRDICNGLAQGPCQGTFEGLGYSPLDSEPLTECLLRFKRFNMNL